MFFAVITHMKNGVIMSFKNKLFKETLKMSSAATQKASKFLVLLLQWTQPNPTHGSTQPMDNSEAACSLRFSWPATSGDIGS